MYPQKSFFDLGSHVTFNCCGELLLSTLSKRPGDSTFYKCWFKLIAGILCKSNVLCALVYLCLTGIISCDLSSDICFYRHYHQSHDDNLFMHPLAYYPRSSLSKQWDFVKFFVPKKWARVLVVFCCCSLVVCVVFCFVFCVCVLCFFWGGVGRVSWYMV